MKYWPPRLIATARIAADGTISRSVGISAVNKPATGNYEISLTNNYEGNSLHISVAPQGSGAPSWGFTENLPPTDTFLLAFQDNTGAAQDAAFTLRVYQDA